MRAIPTLKISISGVRGVIGDSLTPALLTRFAQAFGTHTGSGTIVVGRDPRTSGEMVKHAVIAGILSSGGRVVDIGVCPVPTVQLQVRRRKAHGGIAITASHNPPEWNALKFIGANGLFLDAGQARELLDIYHQGEYTKVGGDEMRSVEEAEGATDAHIKAILDALGPLPERTATDKTVTDDTVTGDSSRTGDSGQTRRRSGQVADANRVADASGGRRLRVVLDSCNGAGSLVGPKLLEALGAEVIPINVTPDGSFPRPAEPLPENLGDLCAAVKQHQADIGFAQDMDADRLAIVSEQGVPIGEDYTLVLAALYVLGHEPGAVVANLSTTSALGDVAKKFGSQLFLTKIGEVNVTDKMQQQNAVIGGEGNGGVIYPRINFARDSLVGMALVLHLLAESGKTVTQLLDEFPRYTVVKEKMVCPSEKIPAVLKMLRQEYGKFEIDTRDGVKVMTPEGWFLVRGSNTEPIIRLVAESQNESQARDMVTRIYKQVATCIES